MTTLLLAEFAHADALVAAARAARMLHLDFVDAYTPFAVEELSELLPPVDKGVRLSMILTGLAVACLAYLLEWWSAVFAYPFNSGGRPLHSWPVFLLFPFEIGILGAAAMGLVVFFLKTGLPRLNDGIFDSVLHEKASLNGFVLALRAPEGQSEHEAARAMLLESGAQSIREAHT